MMGGPTGRVVCVRGRSPEQWAEDPAFLYVGRANRRYRWRWSPFANPYKVGGQLVLPDAPFRYITRRGQAVEAFRINLDLALKGEVGDPQYKSQFRDMAAILGDCRGRVLGCWCCRWRPGDPVTIPCHAIVLCQLSGIING
jgi:hypothetical protein